MPTKVKNKTSTLTSILPRKAKWKFLYLVAPDRRLSTAQISKGNWAWHVQSKNNEITALGEGYNNKQDMIEEIHRLWPHTALLDMTV